MLIDWFTIAAQALNFLILVWLMKRFLYKPVLRAIDTREKLIAAELADANAKKIEAKKDRDEFQHKNAEFDQQRAALMSKATDEAKVERQRLLDEARKAADELTAKRQATMITEAQALNQAISRRTQQEVFAITRKALKDLATTSLEERLGEVFTRRLRTMDAQAKAGLAEALKTASEPALVRSAFDLPAEQRAAIQNALNETFAAEIRVRFETAPNLISGIELTANGQKVAWSIADYLASLEKDVVQLLKKNEKPAAKVAPKTEVKPEPKAETKVEPKTSVAAEPKPAVEAKPEPTTKVEPKPEIKPGPKTSTQAEPKPVVEAEPKPAAKIEPKSDIKPEPKAETKVEPKTSTEAEPKPAVEAKPESTAKVEPKPEAVEPTPVAQ